MNPLRVFFPKRKYDALNVAWRKGIVVVTAENPEGEATVMLDPQDAKEFGEAVLRAAEMAEETRFSRQ